MSNVSINKNAFRKWSGVFWLLIEVNLMGGTIFGFPALFNVLSNHGIYNMYCTNSSTSLNSTATTKDSCSEQTTQYQNAVTLGIVFFDLPSVFVGAITDKFGCRLVKLIAVVFQIIGWLALALIKPGRDYLLFIHTVFSSIAGITVLITSYASSDYFSKSRAFVSTLFAGACTSASIWYSIFQVTIDDGRITLAQLSYIWMSFGLLMVISSFLYLDWKFSFLNLPYQFNTKHEQTNQKTPDNETKTKWYTHIYQRTGVWKHLTSPLYILVVLFLSILLMPSIFLAVTWYPWVLYITQQNTSLATKYTFAFNMSTLAALGICPISGFLLGFRAERDRKQKLLNISIAQTVTWILNIASCIVCMFATTTAIIPALVINCIARAMIVGGSQAVVATFFPSEYIGTLTGVMWTVAGVITFINYALVKLTTDVSQSWRAWAIILAMVVLMSCHLVQIWLKYFRERKKTEKDSEMLEVES